MKRMRIVLSLVVLLSSAVVQAHVAAPESSLPPVLVAQAQPQPAPSEPQPAQPRDVDINVTVGTEEAGAVWYLEPVWLAIWIIGGVILLMLLIMAARGSQQPSATVVKG